MLLTEPEQVAEAAARLEGCAPEEILAWAIDVYQPGIAVSCSFGGPSGLVLAHMVACIDRRVPILFIDTGFLFPETYALKDRFCEKYGLRIVHVRPHLSPEDQAALYGPELWERGPDRCCYVRKVVPMEAALEPLNAWVTGLRRDQSPTRSAIGVLESHRLRERLIVKVNPLAAWTRADVWSYLLAHDIPYNPLLDRGFRSLGCRQCTSPTAPADEPRSGRWPGRPKVECGLHTFTERIC
ncbi:MAG TPA: phosphoadenylyl-sulfate reductase [Limnochordia bacterium]